MKKNSSVGKDCLLFFMNTHDQLYWTYELKLI